MFKVGDKVRLKKEFYKEEEFKGMSRSLKKPIAYLQGKSVSVVSVPNFNRNDVDIIITDGVDIYIFPPCIFELAEPEKKPVVEVSRKAEVGEYIKIVNPFMTFDNYEKGDIFKVKEKYGQDSVRVFGTFNVCICKREYVVLENYVPEEKESELPKKEPKKQIAKVGDFIELIVYNFGDLVGTVAEVIEVNEANVKYKTARSMRGYYYARHDSYEIVEPPKRKWTEEEITKAKCFLAEELIYAKCRFVYDNVIRKTTCYNFETNKLAEAKCAPNDEFNQYIGAVVVYCKTCGVNIPEFIKH